MIIEISHYEGSMSMSPIPQEQYIIDTHGNKTAVILSIDRYQQLLPISDLDPEFQEYLTEILAQEKLTYSQLLKKLLQHYRQTQQPRPTLAQRRGGHPKHLLQDASPDLSLRETRKAIVANHIQQRHQQSSPST